jgi:hypothetical protein
MNESKYLKPLANSEFAKWLRFVILCIDLVDDLTLANHKYCRITQTLNVMTDFIQAFPQGPNFLQYQINFYRF